MPARTSQAHQRPEGHGAPLYVRGAAVYTAAVERAASVYRGPGQEDLDGVGDGLVVERLHGGSRWGGR